MKLISLGARAALFSAVALLALACDPFAPAHVYVDNQSQFTFAAKGTHSDGSAWGWNEIPPGKGEIYSTPVANGELLVVATSSCEEVLRLSLKPGLWLITIDGAGHVALGSLEDFPDIRKALLNPFECRPPPIVPTG